MVHWNCGSALCYNNYKTKNSKGQHLKFYRLPREEATQREYQKLFKTSGFNWKSGYICSAHWINEERKSTSHLPEIIIPSDQMELLQLKFNRSEKRHKALIKPNAKITNAYKTAKNKLTTE